MNFKSITKIFLSCVMAGALFAGCGGGEQSAQKTDDNKTFQVGMITHLNATEHAMGEIYNKAIEQANIAFSKYEPKFYDSLSLMQMGIESGEVKTISTYRNVADYLLANNDKYEIDTNFSPVEMSDNFCLAVRKDDAALKADLDKAIDEMKSDGSLDKLVKEYITDINKGQTPPAIEIPMTDGAQTIKVGVTGDLPPLDYVSADGKAAGFNTALLAEVAKRSGKNVEVVNIASSARAAALSSGQIDVIFWVVVPDGDKFPADIDTPEGVELSAPYFQDNVYHLKLKDSK